ncbi:MAG: alpha/beta fold hydrolase [Myxococcota bacterium]
MIDVALWAALASALALLAFVLLTSRALTRDGTTARSADLLSTVATTEDGWRLQLDRYRGEGLPVLVCHGIATRSQNMDVHDDHSIARALHAQGHDVWLLNLRGCGTSCSNTGRVSDICLDDFVRQDAPAALVHIMRETGASQVDWVGFSMGGIVGTAVLGEPVGKHLRSLTLIGAPLRGASSPYLGPLMRLGLALFRRRGAVPLRLFSRLGARLPRVLVNPFLRPIMNPKNVPWRPTRLVMDQTVEDIPIPLLEQMNAWRHRPDHHASSRDGAVDYVSRLAEAPAIPILCISGTGDTLGPLAATVPAFRHHRGSREVRVIGRGAQAHIDRWAPSEDDATAREHPQRWGHLDLLLSRDAPVEVFKPVGEFLARCPS